MKLKIKITIWGVVLNTIIHPLFNFKKPNIICYTIECDLKFLTDGVEFKNIFSQADYNFLFLRNSLLKCYKCQKNSII